MSALQVEPRSNNIHLTLKNRDGSVEHYYHFLLGFLVPLTLAHDDSNRNKPGKHYIRSCGILDQHISDIGFEQLEIIDRDLHQSINPDNGFTSPICVHEFAQYDGYDDPAYYCQDSFRSARAILLERLQDKVAEASQRLRDRSDQNSPTVVLIDREPPAPFYLSKNCEIDGAGRARRSIPNFSELFTAVDTQCSNTISTTLENKSLAYQIALFMHADIIVAQHGAALANLIWCDPETILIEIMPDDLPDCLREKNFFSNLARCMGLHYFEVPQEGRHTNVEIDWVLSAMKNSGR